MKNIYIQNEVKKSFKGWTKEGLEFLLLYPYLSKRIKTKIESKLKGEF
jgi:hypothetical protein